MFVWAVGESIHNLCSLDFMLGFGFVSGFVLHEVPSGRWRHFGFPNARETILEAV